MGYVMDAVNVILAVRLSAARINVVKAKDQSPKLIL
jgi:hypothetical protein